MKENEEVVITSSKTVAQQTELCDGAKPEALAKEEFWIT